MIYFTIATSLALVIGLVAVNVVKPGVGVNLPSEQSAEAKEISARAQEDDAAGPRRGTSSRRSVDQGDGGQRGAAARRLQLLFALAVGLDRREGPAGRRASASRSPRRCSSSPTSS
jgi:proton glutamate symport protein